MSIHSNLESGLKLAFAWCEINAIVPPLDLCVRAMPYVKSLEFFKRTIVRLVKSVYDGNIGGEFVGTMTNLIKGQMRRAYQEAWNEDGNDGKMPDYLVQAAEALAEEQAGFVPQFYRDIIDARVDESPIDPLLYRADLWANRYNQAKSEAAQLIAQESGGKLIWKLGETEEHCETCAALNGIVAYATEWATSGFRPQSAPNKMLECGGWKCDCALSPTDKRRSPKAIETLMNIAVSRGLE